METKSRTLAELLADPTDEEELVQSTCRYCGYTQKEQFQRCPSCNQWNEYPTLGVWGKQLPIGVESNGKLMRSFDLKPLNWVMEREINNHWAARRSSITIGEYIGTILAVAVTQIGNQDISKFKFEKRLLVFNQMYQADIFYMYAYLRLISVGHEMKMSDVACGSCGFRFPFTADLRSLEVVVIDNPKDLVSELNLSTGFDLNGQNRSKLKLKPPLWNMMGPSLPTNNNQAEVFAALLSNCVVGIEGMPEGTTLTEREISQFTKHDIGICQDMMDKIIAGPRWEVEGNCPKCNSEFYDIVDWGYDSFFAISSVYRRQKNRSRRSLR